MPANADRDAPSPQGRSSSAGVWRNPRTQQELLRLFLLIYLPLAAVVISLLMAVTQVRIEQRLNAIRIQETGQVQVAAHIISHDLHALSSDLRLLAHSPLLQAFLESESDSNRARLTEILLNVANEKRSYDQIRYIDAEGMERVRINFTTNGAVVVPETELQPKGERYYFKDSLRQQRGDIYVSPLDLNIEHQQIERPFKPMLRLGTPVFDRAGVKRGVIVLNAFGQQLLDDFRHAMGDSRHAMLLNRDGYWLSHPDASRAWGFMFDSDDSFAAQYPKMWSRLLAEDKGSIYSDDGLFTFTTIHPLLSRHHSSTGSSEATGSSHRDLEAQEYFWKAVSLVPAEELPRSAWQQLRNYLPELLFGLLLLAVLVGFLATALLSRRQWRKTVFENETRLREITATLGEGVYVLDRQGLVTFANPETERLLGWREAELLGRHGHNTFHYRTPEGRQLSADECPVHRTINTGETYHALHDWLIRKDGELIPVSIVSTPIIRAGEVVGSVAAFQDITTRLEAERSLRESEARFRSALENAPIGMAIVSLDERITEANLALCRILGYQREELEGLNLAAITHPEDLPAGRERRKQLLAGEIHTYQLEKRYLRKNRQTVWTQMTGSLLRDADNEPICFLVQIEDISERKQQQEQIRQLAFYDTLTGLPNRRLFLDHFDQALTQAKRFKRSLALLFLDLDHFKEVNDTLGHDVGDDLLIEVANRLSTSIRHGDTVSRQGGDEFVIILSEIHHPDDAAQVADKIIHMLCEPFVIHDHAIRIGASIGIAIYPVDGSDDIQELMKKADSAMYLAKEGGRNRYHFFKK